MASLYITDYGPVQVSFSEGMTLGLFHDMKEQDLDNFPAFKAKALSIIEACNKVGLYNSSK